MPMNLSNIDVFPFIEKSIPPALDMAGNIIVALLMFLIGRFIAKKIVRISEAFMIRSKIDVTLITFLGNVIFGVLMVVVIMASLNKVGVNTSSLVAVVGGASVAIGLALKDQLSNFAAGVLIILFRPINKGDLVKIGDHEGTVHEISLLNTNLITLNNHKVVIPNGEITAHSLTNFSAFSDRRVDIVIGISYDSDIRIAKKIMLNVASSDDLVFSDPIPTVVVKSLSDSSVDLLLSIWTTNDDWLSVQGHLLEKIKYAFDENQIEIPFPQQVVHMINSKKSV